MKSIILLPIVFFILFGHQALFAQLQTPGFPYDSVGVRVDLEKDLMDTLTPLPKTHAKIRLPRFFEFFSYKEFAGFIHKGTSTTIMAFEYPETSVLAYIGTMNDSLFKAKGMEVLEVFDMKQNNGDAAKVYILRLNTERVPVIRIMYFTGNYNTMYYLVANIPEAVSKLIRNALLASFQTLEY